MKSFRRPHVLPRRRKKISAKFNSNTVGIYSLPRFLCVARLNSVFFIFKGCVERDGSFADSKTIILGLYFNMCGRIFETKGHADFQCIFAACVTLSMGGVMC